MRYGIFSDVHSNLEALHAVLSVYKKENIDKYLCIGDIVGYASNPLECIKIVRETADFCVAGNHDWAAVNKFSLDFFNPIAKAAVVVNSKQLSKEEEDYLSSLGLTYEDEYLTLVHGTLQEAGFFHYLVSEDEAIKTARLMKTNLCFVGHTHRPEIFEIEKDVVSILRLECLKINKNHRYIINVGSVGQPRDGNWRAAYCIFDSEKREVYIKRIEYDIKTTQKKILKAGLPEFLATRLSFGR
ncbi:MAG: metallophosphoesterase family protein [Candidatus Omnitrophota bacterium]